MSGIYIPGMELPHEGQIIVIDSTGQVWSNEWPTRGYMRIDGTKAIPVPEHGRLIDLDAIPKSAWRGEKEDLVDELILAPTIIPASGGTDMSISLPPIPEPVAEAYAKMLYRSGDRTDICEKCVHQDGCKDRETFHKNHPECAITFCSGYERQQTNSDRIRQMSDEELARWIADDLIEPGYYSGDECYQLWLDWLKSPVEVDK